MTLESIFMKKRPDGGGPPSRLATAVFGSVQGQPCGGMHPCYLTFPRPPTRLTHTTRPSFCILGNVNEPLSAHKQKGQDIFFSGATQQASPLTRDPRPATPEPEFGAGSSEARTLELVWNEGGDPREYSRVPFFFPFAENTSCGWMKFNGSRACQRVQNFFLLVYTQSRAELKWASVLIHAQLASYQASTIYQLVLPPLTHTFSLSHSICPCC